MKKKLKLGLIIHTPLLFWEYTLIKKIIDSNYASIDYIVQYTNKPSVNIWKYIFLKMYIKLDKKLFKISPNAFSFAKDTDELFKNVNILSASTTLTNSEIIKIKNQKLDILINLSPNKLTNDILNSSKYGVWGYVHGNYKIDLPLAEGFYEIMKEEELFLSTLEIFTKENKNNKLMSYTVSKVDRFSLNRHKNNYQWKALSLLPREIEKLYKLGEDKFFEQIKDNKTNIPMLPKSSIDIKKYSNLRVLILMILHFIKVLKIKIKDKMYLSQWILLFKFEENRLNNFDSFTKIVPPKDKFYADPFPIYKDGNHYIFIEELPYKTWKGHLSVIKIDENGTPQDPIKIIEEDYHLSYPHIIQEDNEYYMIPESCSNKTIDLYKCIEFPYKWKFHKNIMRDIMAVDSTIFFYNKKYWLFCNILENNGASNNDELFLFYADSLLSNYWTPHPLNPIVSDVRNSRPAGNIYIDNNRIFRPSQNCKKWYGYGITLNEILILNETEYKEKVVKKVIPDWDKNINAIHTFNHTKGLTVIDAIYNRK